jgi:hypothetical protein
MSGTGNRMFSPQADYTREQSIATIMRAFGFVRTDEPFVRVRIEYPDFGPDALEFIYYDGFYRYYLPQMISGSIMLHFEDGTVVSLRESLDTNLISFSDLLLNGLNVIMESQSDI